MPTGAGWTAWIPATCSLVVLILETAAASMAGRVALVTGSSAGIGKEIARRLHESGADVFVSGRDLGRCERTIEEIRGSSPGSGTLTPLPMDLADFHSVRAAAAALADLSAPASRRPQERVFELQGLCVRVRELEFSKSGTQRARRGRHVLPTGLPHKSCGGRHRA